MDKQSAILVKGQIASALIGELYVIHTTHFKDIETLEREHQATVKLMTNRRDALVIAKMRDVIGAMGEEKPADDDHSWYVDFRYFKDLGLAFLNRHEPHEIAEQEYKLTGEEPLSDEPPEEGSTIN